MVMGISLHRPAGKLASNPPLHATQRLLYQRDNNPDLTLGFQGPPQQPPIFPSRGTKEPIVLVETGMVEWRQERFATGAPPNPLWTEYPECRLRGVSHSVYIVVQAKGRPNVVVLRVQVRGAEFVIWPQSRGNATSSSQDATVRGKCPEVRGLVWSYAVSCVYLEQG